MANKEHLKILKQGVDAWNRWRDRDLELRPDLSGANLSKLFARELSLHGIVGMRVGGGLDKINFGNTDLSHADLSFVGLVDAYLVAADLRHANLSETMLGGSDLSRANLSGANLHGAELDVANLHDAELGQADLSSALLLQAVFDQTRVSGAVFSASTMAYTLFGNVDLSGAQGLDAVNHIAPSTIGVDTIYSSKGKIPETFLRGAGVPEAFITYAKSLVVEPIEYYSCFISYSSKDQEFADLLHSQLQGKGARVWLATEDLKIGDRFRAKIDEAIRLHDKLLLVLSKSSVKSAWVEAEVEAAFEKERKQKRTVLFPIRLDDAVMATEEAWASEIRRTRHIGDFREWKNHDKYKEAFGRLMRDLKAVDG
jgi:uncharacterized protein YjbI with pentapeptide repeats